MRPVIFIGSLAAAAAAGAAACYVLGTSILAFNPAPGNGAVTCPGNDACPAQNRAVDRRIRGIAVKDSDITSGAVILCDGTATVPGCREGYQGYLVRYKGAPDYVATDPEQAAACNGTTPCRTGYQMLYCQNSSSAKPTKGCAVLPQLQNPGW